MGSIQTVSSHLSKKTCHAYALHCIHWYVILYLTKCNKLKLLDLISVVNDISRKPDQERRGGNVSQSKRVDIPPHKNLSQLIYFF